MRIPFILIGLLILALSFGAVAIDFNVIIVEASKDGSGFDSSLNAYKKQLSDMGYKSGKIISSNGLDAAVGESKKFDVAGDITAEIKPTSVTDGFINFEFKMFQGESKIITVSYKIPNGKHTIIVGPASKKNKYIIIIKASQ
jgi:hypothetical protein